MQTTLLLTPSVAPAACRFTRMRRRPRSSPVVQFLVSPSQESALSRPWHTHSLQRNCQFRLSTSLHALTTTSIASKNMRADWPYPRCAWPDHNRDVLPWCASEEPHNTTKMLREDLQKRGFIYTLYKEPKSGAATKKMADDRHHFILLPSALPFSIFYIRRTTGS